MYFYKSTSVILKPTIIQNFGKKWALIFMLSVVMETEVFEKSYFVITWTSVDQKIVLSTQLSVYHKTISVFKICYMFQPKRSSSGKKCTMYESKVYGHWLCERNLSYIHFLLYDFVRKSILLRHMSIHFSFIYCIICAWWWPLRLKLVANCKNRDHFYKKKNSCIDWLIPWYIKL
jgi:hypothetical protein